MSMAFGILALGLAALMLAAAWQAWRYDMADTWMALAAIGSALGAVGLFLVLL